MAKKMKVDKVRKVTVNRYGMDKADSLLELLHAVLDDYVGVLENEDAEDTGWNADSLERAKSALADMVKRMDAGVEIEKQLAEMSEDEQEDTDNE